MIIFAVQWKHKISEASSADIINENITLALANKICHWTEGSKWLY